MDWVGETGARKDHADYGAARRRLASADEDELKRLRAYGSAPQPASPPAPFHEHFGFVVASCERADLRPTASGVEIYAGDARQTIEMRRSAAPRASVIDELWSAVIEGATPLHDGAWGEANLAVCLAILKSSAEVREVMLDELENAR
jgi:phthalate 4,5-cis-dihydrodiol dehydrogenase